DEEPRIQRCMAPRSAPLDAETFSATALALDVWVAELEGLVQAFLHEVDLRAVDQLEALAVDDDLHVALVEDHIVRVDLVGVVDHVGPARAAGTLHSDSQAHPVAAPLEV